MKKILGFLLLLNLIFITLACDYENPVVVFGDERLEQVVRDILDNQEEDIYARDVRSITVLEAVGKNIVSLQGLEYFTELEQLNLEDNFIEDLSPLSSIQTLEWLNLRNNEITNLETIKFDQIIDLPLIYLSLRHNVIRDEFDNQTRISDISLLANFTELEVLDLRDNHIHDMTPIESLLKLTYLDISQNPIDDHSLLSLENLTELRELNIRETGVTNLDVLSGLTKLTYLNIHSNTLIDSISFISQLTQLEELIAQNIPIGDQINLLSNLTNLKRINLQNTGITSLTVLKDLMEAGALQDIPMDGVVAEVNIGANLLTEEDYRLLEPYWQNIGIRVPSILPIGDTETPYINEIMASNGDSILDSFGNNEDWIEIYNPGTEGLDISGYYLSDELSDVLKWSFPENTIIPAKGFIIVFASGKDIVLTNEIHTNFSLNRDGEPIFLTHKDGETQLDYLPSVVMPRNYSYGRSQDGENQWVYFDLYNLSPGLSNNDSEPYDTSDSTIPNDFSFNIESFDRFFNDEEAKNIVIKISEEEWNTYDEVMVNYSEIFNGELRTDYYAKADFIYEDQYGQVLIGNVGFRTKGNMSRVRIQNDDGSLNMSNFKISFHESFNEPENDFFSQRTVFEVEELDMKWNRNYDPTYSTEKYSLDLMRNFGVHAAHATLANVYIEIGDERYYYGVYTIFEPIDELFLNRRFEEEKATGDLFKSLWQQYGPASLLDNYPYRAIGIKDVSMNYRPAYDLKTNKDTFDRTHLETFISQINDLNGDDFDQYISTHFDVDQFLRYMAVGVLLGNPDDYRAMGNNYYLYQESMTGIWSIIPYDYDHGLGQGWEGSPVFSNYTIENDIYEWGNLNAYLQGTNEPNPLSDKILKIERYQLQYEAYLKELINPENQYFSYEVFYELYLNHQALYEENIDQALIVIPFGLRNAQWYFEEKIASIESQIAYYENNPEERPSW